MTNVALEVAVFVIKSKSKHVGRQRPPEDNPILVLTRRVNEKIRIGDDIIITLLGVRGNQYKVGIEAPKELPVHREEIWQRIQDAKRMEERHD